MRRYLILYAPSSIAPFLTVSHGICIFSSTIFDCSDIFFFAAECLCGIAAVGICTAIVRFNAVFEVNDYILKRRRGGICLRLQLR